jgi:hypothetical protein
MIEEFDVCLRSHTQQSFLYNRSCFPLAILGPMVRGLAQLLNFRQMNLNMKLFQSMIRLNLWSLNDLTKLSYVEGGKQDAKNRRGEGTRDVQKNV